MSALRFGSVAASSASIWITGSVRFAAAAAGGAFTGAEPREVEPWVTVKKLDEMLAHHSGSAEDTYFYFVHESCNCLTIF